MKRLLLFAVVLLVGCVGRLELEPDIEGTIVTLEVEGQTRSQANPATRTVTIELEQEADLASVRVTRLVLGPTATADIAVGDVLDLTAPRTVIVTTVASYTWTVSASRAHTDGRALPGGDFEQWYRADRNDKPDPAGRVWNPWPEGGVWEQDRWWDTGNKGVALLYPGNSTPTEPGEGCPDNPSGRAARLESVYAVVKAAGGNIYFGKFGELNGLNATCELGHNWQTRPRRLRGWYKYFPQPVDAVHEGYVSLHPYGLSYDEWMGSPDSLHVCMALWASPDGRDIPFTVDTTPERFVDFSRDADGVLAYGSFVSAREQASWDEFAVEMEYFIPASEPLPANTQLYLLVTASKNCNYFIAGTGRNGGNGSLMYVDELRLEY